jgi:glycine cleavage system aminomethyltransferase T
MTAVLRRHGAVLVERDGRLVAAHFGSPAGEVAVCRTTVGLAVRSDRVTLEVLGSSRGVDDALEGLVPLGDRTWWTRVAPGLALVRCEPGDAPASMAHLDRSESVSVKELSTEYTALELIGPLAEVVAREAGVGTEEDPTIAMAESPSRVELLVPAALGPAMWNRLLAAGESYDISCVGLEALEHLAASEHLGGAAR